MSEFEKLVLRGLWLILQQSIRSVQMYSGTAQMSWAMDVAKAVGDDKLKNI